MYHIAIAPLILKRPPILQDHSELMCACHLNLITCAMCSRIMGHFSCEQPSEYPMNAFQERRSENVRQMCDISPSSMMAGFSRRFPVWLF